MTARGIELEPLCVLGLGGAPAGCILFLHVIERMETDPLVMTVECVNTTRITFVEFRDD